MLLILLMFISVSSCSPVYAEDNESYTLEPGKVYRFKKVAGESLTAEFSEHVLRSIRSADNDYLNINHYGYYNYINSSPFTYLNVYNINSKSVTMTVNEGAINEVAVFESPFSLVMYDGTGTEFQIINNIDNYVYCKRYGYNESDHSFEAKGNFISIRVSETLTGSGFLLFRANDKFNNTTFQGVYEVSNYIRSGFFQVPPWILRMDLAGTIRVLLDQLSMLLPVALVVLSIFLVVNFLIYIVHLFL
jgi:hypothetical protein